MQFKNKYAYRAKISEAQLKGIVKLFTTGVSATTIAEQVGLNRNSANKYLMGLREVIAESCKKTAPEAGSLAFDAYFLDLRQDVAKGGPRRVDKSFGVFCAMPDGRVFAHMLPQEKNAALWEFLAGRVVCGPQDGEDRWRCYEDFGYLKYFRAVGRSCLSGGRTPEELIEAFWMGAKERFIKLRGVPCHTFYLHLKECEFRFNHEARSLSRTLLKMLEENPLGSRAGESDSG